MTNTVAIALALLLIGAVAVDAWANDLAGSLFVARKGLQLIDYLAFWR